MTKTTKKDFELFKKECQKWVDFFGLKHWRIEYFHAERKGLRAACETSYWDKTADIILATEWTNKALPRKIKKTAFHEVTEILMAPIRDSLKVYISDGEAHRLNHEVIHCLENCVFERLK